MLVMEANRSRRPSAAGPDRWAPLESLMRRMMREAYATQWVVGVLDVTHDFIEFYRASAEIDARTALDIISRIPSTHTLQRDEHGSWISASMMIDQRRSLRMALLRDADAPWWSGAEPIQRYLEQIAPHILSTSLPATMERDLPSLRRHSHPAMYLLNADYEVEFQWHAQDLASVALAHLAEPVDGHLPAFLESRVRRMTSTWDLCDVKTCTVSSAYPIPGLVLRTVPMQSASRISIGVLLEPYATRRTIEHTATNLRVSSREREVLYLLLDGESIADIAAKLNIAESTVQDHVKRMILKTDSRNRVEMAAKILGWPSMRPECRRPELGKV
jgi:DNA-binding CsgD family transcriptional regulator